MKLHNTHTTADESYALSVNMCYIDVPEKPANTLMSLGEYTVEGLEKAEVH